ISEFAGMSPDKIVFDQINAGVEGDGTFFPSYEEFLRKIRPTGMTFLTNSIPRSHLYDFPDLSFFQIFYTGKTMVGHPALQDVNFSFDLPQKSVFLESLEPVAQSLYLLPS